MDPDDLAFLIRLELDLMRDEVALRDEVLDLLEAGFVAGGHWGDDSARFADLLEYCNARAVFPARNWWA